LAMLQSRDTRPQRAAAAASKKPAVLPGWQIVERFNCQVFTHGATGNGQGGLKLSIAHEGAGPRLTAWTAVPRKTWGSSECQPRCVDRLEAECALLRTWTAIIKLARNLDYNISCRPGSEQPRSAQNLDGSPSQNKNNVDRIVHVLCVPRLRIRVQKITNNIRVSC
jgi:hypothetical protein